MEKALMLSGNNYYYVCAFCSNRIAIVSDLEHTWDPSRTMAGTAGIFRDNLFNLCSVQTSALGPFKIYALSCNKCKKLLGWKCDQSPEKNPIIHMHMEKLMLWNGIGYVQAVGHQHVDVNIPCEVCKYIRRKCTPACVFARYFQPGDVSETRFQNVRLTFGVSKVAKLLTDYKLPLTDSIMRSILFESDGRSIYPAAAGRVCRLIGELEHDILKTTVDLQNTNDQLRPYRLANEQGHTPCSTSGRKQIPSFNSSEVCYMCRNCRICIALCEDLYRLEGTPPHRGLFNKAINLHTSGKELLRDDGPEEVNLYCDDCDIHLGMNIVVEAAPEAPFATTSMTALQLDKLLLRYGKYALEAVPSQANMPRVAAPIGPAPIAAPIRRFARQAPVQERVVIIEDDNETTQDQLWNNVEAQDG